MAKLTSFFRRIYNAIVSDDEYPSTESRKSIVIIPPLTPPPIPTTKPVFPILNNTSRSCSASPRPTNRGMIKQTTIEVDNQDGNRRLNLMHKSTNRRLSAPLIIHSSTHHYRQHRSAIVDECFEEALISPLQRLSLSSTTGTSVYQNNSVNSLGTSAAGSANASPRNDVHSPSFNLSPSNSINLPSSSNNISPASGRYRRGLFDIVLSLYRIQN